MRVAEAFTPYVRPQESGGRDGVRWFRLAGSRDGTVPALAVHVDEPRQVSWTHYRASDLDAARHHEELTPRPEVVVHLDAAHRGLGTASCGPDALPRYRLGPGTYRWSWLLAATAEP
jgi:beta-galactosidase